MKTPAKPIDQDELALNSVRAHAIFGTRQTLYVNEVATVLRVSIQHVIDLIEEYRDTAGQSGLFALNVANHRSCLEIPKGVRVPRGCWRIPVSAYDDFLRRAGALANQPTPTTTKL